MIILKPRFLKRRLGLQLLAAILGPPLFAIGDCSRPIDPVCRTVLGHSVLGSLVRVQLEERLHARSFMRCLMMLGTISTFHPKRKCK
jgi:hypothetical protein